MLFCSKSDLCSIIMIYEKMILNKIAIKCIVQGSQNTHDKLSGTPRHTLALHVSPNIGARTTCP